VVLLDHVHLLFFPRKSKDLSKIVQFLKRHTTRDINYVIGYDLPHNPEVAIRESLLRVRDRLLKRKFFILDNKTYYKKVDKKYGVNQELIKDHSEFLEKLNQKFVMKYGNNQNQLPKFKWQKSFHDHYIRNKDDFDKHLQYIYNNPIKHKISNAKNYQYGFTSYSKLIDEY